MNAHEFCESAGLTLNELQHLIDCGLVVSDRSDADGRCREIPLDQLDRVRVVKALQRKGIPLSRLARENLKLEGQSFVIFDGQDLRVCRDAAAAIVAVVKAKRWCCGVDLTAIRAGDHETR